MQPGNNEQLIRLVKRHEGIRLRVYWDQTGRDAATTDRARGHLTIGIGRNLSNGIREDEAELMLQNDLQESWDACRGLFPSFDGLSEVRQAVLVSMAFNLGRQKLRGFIKLRGAIESNDYESASREMLDSRWARQVKNRAVELAKMMETDQWPGEVSSPS